MWLVPTNHVGSVAVGMGVSDYDYDLFNLFLTPSGYTDLGLNPYGFDIQQIDFTFASIPLPRGGTGSPCLLHQPLADLTSTGMKILG